MASRQDTALRPSSPPSPAAADSRKSTTPLEKSARTPAGHAQRCLSSVSAFSATSTSSVRSSPSTRPSAPLPSAAWRHSSDTPAHCAMSSATRTATMESSLPAARAYASRSAPKASPACAGALRRNAIRHRPLLCSAEKCSAWTAPRNAAKASPWAMHATPDAARLSVSRTPRIRSRVNARMPALWCRKPSAKMGLTAAGSAKKASPRWPDRILVSRPLTIGANAPRSSRVFAMCAAANSVSRDTDDRRAPSDAASASPSKTPLHAWCARSILSHTSSGSVSGGAESLSRSGGAEPSMVDRLAAALWPSRGAPGRRKPRLGVRGSVPKNRGGGGKEGREGRESSGAREGRGTELPLTEPS